MTSDSLFASHGMNILLWPEYMNCTASLVHRTIRCVACWIYIFGSSDLSRKSSHPKFDLTEVQAHVLWIMYRTFHAREVLVLKLQSHQEPQIYVARYMLGCFWPMGL